MLEFCSYLLSSIDILIKFKFYDMFIEILQTDGTPTRGRSTLILGKYRL